jgi:homoserine dehydrogenase
VIATLSTLLRTGDRVEKIEGCMSGTLGYLCTQLERGVAYSKAITQARSLGYTEPDPREDLSGRDVARKALILAHTAGWPLEFADLTVEPMYPQSLSDVSTQEFLEAVPTVDESYARRVAEARAQGRVVRYVARVSRTGGTVGLAEVEPSSLLGALRGPANYFAFQTIRYSEEPLVVSGPGAGPDVTAAGVLGDIFDLALQHAHSGTRHSEEMQA